MWWRLLQLSIAVFIANVTFVQGYGRRTRRNTSKLCDEKYRVFPGHTACLDKSPDAVSYVLTEQQKQDIVKKHNDLRRQVQPPPTDMLKMSWDDEVAMIAQKWTDSCPVFQNGSIRHDEGYQRFIPGRFTLGQNLALSHSSFSGATDDWYSEESDYVYGQPYQSFKKNVGHYTQLVWATSYKVGCSMTKCSNRIVYSCNYAPSGNIVPFNQPYSSGGSSQCSQDDKGLCDCENLECINNVPLDVSTCTCDCQPKYYVDQFCKLNCNLSDASYCGTVSNYQDDDCYGNLALSVIEKCPTMCKICPYALPGYGDGGKPGEGSAPATSRSTFTWTITALLLMQQIYSRHFLSLNFSFSFV